MISEIIIRAARAGDFPSLWQLATDNRVYLPEPENDIWIAEKNATVVAFIACAFAVDEMNLLGIAVYQTERRKGIAHLLHHAALSTLQPTQCFLEVRESNLPAQKLYQKWGYEKIGRRKGYYRTVTGGFEDAIVMRLSLPK